MGVAQRAVKCPELCLEEKLKDSGLGKYLDMGWWVAFGTKLLDLLLLVWMIIARGR